MNFLQAKQQLSRRLEQDYTSPQFWPFADLGSFINEAYILTCARHNLIETSGTLSLVANQWIYDLASGCHCVLRVYSATTEQLLIPATFNQIAAYDGQWIQTTATTPYLYAMINSHQIFFYPAPSAAAADDITYHYSSIPSAMSGDQEVPDLPKQYHDLLLDYAEGIALLRERALSSKQKAIKCMSIYREKLDALVKKKNNISNKIMQARSWGT